MKGNKKLVFLSLVAILVAFTLIAGVSAVRYAHIMPDKTTTVALGNAGVTYANAYKEGTVKIIRRDDAGYHAPFGYNHMEKLVELRFWDPEWVPQKYPAGSVLVFYNLTSREQRLFNDGLFKIYFYDTWKGGWTVCPTYALKGGARLACRFHAYGVFGLMAKTR